MYQGITNLAWLLKIWVSSHEFDTSSQWERAIVNLLTNLLTKYIYKFIFLQKLHRLKLITYSKKIEFIKGKLYGGGGRDRTDDLKLAKLPLSQLSYAPIKLLVGQGRFELPTSRLSSARSNQLSYWPETEIQTFKAQTKIKIYAKGCEDSVVYIRS